MTGEDQQAQAYQAVVLAYEQVGSQIHALIQRYGGHSDAIPPDQMNHYRQLAAQRDDLYNQLKTIEASWLTED